MEKEVSKSTNNDFGIASFICGLLSLTLFFTIIPAMIFGILGVIFGVIQRKRTKNKWSLTGIIFSIIGIILAMGVILIIFSVLKDITDSIKSCAENPALPGCEEVLKYINQQSNTQYG